MKVGNLTGTQVEQSLNQMNVKTSGKEALIQELKNAGVSSEEIEKATRNSSELSKFLNENKGLSLKYDANVYFDDKQFVEVQATKHKDEIVKNDNVMGKNGSIFNACKNKEKEEQVQ